MQAGFRVLEQQGSDRWRYVVNYCKLMDYTAIVVEMFDLSEHVPVHTRTFYVLQGRKSTSHKVVLFYDATRTFYDLGTLFLDRGTTPTHQSPEVTATPPQVQID